MSFTHRNIVCCGSYSAMFSHKRKKQLEILPLLMSGLGEGRIYQQEPWDLAIHMEFLKGEHRRHLKSPALIHLQHLHSVLKAFHRGQWGKSHSQPRSHQQVFFCPRSLPPRVLGHICPALALPTRKWQRFSLPAGLFSSALSPRPWHGAWNMAWAQGRC